MHLQWPSVIPRFSRQPFSKGRTSYPLSHGVSLLAKKALVLLRWSPRTKNGTVLRLLTQITCPSNGATVLSFYRGSVTP